MNDRYRSLDKTGIFLLNRMPDGEAAEAISELNDMLIKMNCGSIQVEESQDPDNNRYYAFMTIKFNAAAAAGYNRRDAGRHKKQLSGANRWNCTVGDVKKMLEAKTADEVAKELGISRSTLFRRIKEKPDSWYF